MIATSPHIQLSRLMARNKELSAQEARNRISSQGSVEEKVQRTEARGKGRGYVIWNDGSRGDLEQEVQKVMREVERARKGVWRWVFWSIWPIAIGWAVWEVWRGWRGRRAWEREVERGRGREKKEG